MLFRSLNNGVSNARNNGIKKATGDFILFLDSDDYLDKNAIEILLNKIKKEPDIQAIIFGFSEKMSAEQVEKEYSFENITYYNSQQFMNNYAKLLIKRVVSGAGFTLYNTEIIRKNHLSFNEKMSYGEDTLFVFNYLIRCDKIKVISDILYKCQRINDNSLTKKWNFSKLECINELFARINIYFAENKIVVEQRILFEQFIISQYLNYLQDMVKNCLSRKLFLQEYKKVSNTFKINEWLRNNLKFTSVNIKIIVYFMKKDWANSLFIYLYMKEKFKNKLIMHC